MDLTNPKSKRGCLVMGCLIAGGVPLLLLGILLLIIIGRESSANRQLQAELKKLQAAQLPYDAASLQQYYQQQTDPSNQSRWQAALKNLASEELRQSSQGVVGFDGQVQEDIPLPGQSWDPQSETTHRKFLEQWNGLYDELLDLALQAKPVRFEIDFANFQTQLDHVQDMRRAARLIHLNGKVALYDRDSVGTDEATRGLLGASQTLSGEVLLVGQLVSIALDGMALDLLKQGTQSGVLQSSELQQLLPEILAFTEVGDVWRRTLIGERGFALPAFQNTVPTVGITLPGRSRDTLLYLEFSQRAIDLPTDDIDGFLRGSKQLQNDFQQSISGNWLAIYDSLMTGTLTPALNATSHAFARRAVQHRLAAVAIGLRLHQQQHGSFPQSLAELSQLKMGLEQLGPGAGKAFGYRLGMAGKAQLWSYNIRKESSVPLEPYDLSSRDGDDPIWVWELEP